MAKFLHKAFTYKEAQNLIENGANIDRKLDNIFYCGRTPLNQAAFESKLEVVKCLGKNHALKNMNSSF